ncbi:helix-turn-helix domain-containing protein [Desulfosediminicola sp.]|uniref:helix-turn-helix domain-containing protein n=1 Tax=Desulfosediminicola sp. TaxID=2886825 RepID=UPI003AF20CD0
MPWKETTMMDEKLEFINEWKSGNFSFSELCREFDITRPTGYKYIKRFQERGFDGLLEQSRRPRGHPPINLNNFNSGLSPIVFILSFQILPVQERQAPTCKSFNSTWVLTNY